MAAVPDWASPLVQAGGLAGVLGLLITALIREWLVPGSYAKRVLRERLEDKQQIVDAYRAIANQATAAAAVQMAALTELANELKATVAAARGGANVG